MLKSTLVRVASILSLVAVVACGGSGSEPGPGSDAASHGDSAPTGLADDSGNGQGDGGGTAGGEGGVSIPEAGDTNPDGGDTGEGGGTTEAGGVTEAGGTTQDGGVPAADGVGCSGNGDCANGHCVSGVCCASACTTPGVCQVAAGATCSGGSTCVYPNAPANTACNDGDACTKTDACQNGTCVGSGTVSCDDGNPCTADSCVSPTGCVHDGTGIMTAGCMTGDLCSTYKCTGDKAGTCAVTAHVDCSGSSDQCHTGTCSPATGTCTADPAPNEAAPCEDGNACTTGDTCHSGTCTGGPALSCNDGNPCTDDLCDPTLGCKTKNNTAACDDGNPCTVGDKCAGGSCVSTPKDCSSQDDACNVGVCTGGTCGKSPRADNTACDDGHACTPTDVCVGGACHGSGNSCGTNATACSEGPPKACTCSANYVSSGGQCVPVTNECAATPCVANATCNDPSSAPNDVVCTCPTGFSGDGKVAGTGCTNINDCVGNPCGAFGTCVDGINTHTCTCNAGYVSVNGSCVCDMNGVFAQEFSLATSWSNIPLFEDATNVPSQYWAIRSQTYDASGHLVIKTTQCGSSTVDLCGENDPLVPDEAYAQYLPSTIFGKASMPVGTLTITLTNALPNQPYTEPQSASLLGISLTDPLGAWPAAVANIGPGASQTNGAVWVDHDGDGFIGVTNYAVPPGGIAHSTSPFPAQDYGANSVACPRRSASLARLPYNYLPGIENLALRRVKRLYSAQRLISSLTGKITSCDATGATLIQGTVGGPDNGQVQASARVGGCVRVNGTGEIDCSSALSGLYDGENQTQHITSGSFVIKRVASTVTCADVRAMTFP